MDSLADRTQSEALYIDILEGYPCTFRRIVTGMYDSLVIHLTEVEQIECVDIHAGVLVDIGDGEEILHLFDVKAGFLLDLTDDALLARFLIIHKTARQVKGALAWLFPSDGHQQLSFAVDDEGSRRRTGVLVVGEPAVRTMLALEVMDLEQITAAFRTVMESI